MLPVGGILSVRILPFFRELFWKSDLPRNYSASMPDVVATTRLPGFCLIHQQAELSTSPLGLVCPCCKQAVYLQPASKHRSYWESQPGAYTLDKQPIFIHVRQTDTLKIRSLRPE